MNLVSKTLKENISNRLQAELPESLFFHIGEYAPQIIIILAIFALYKSPILLFTFLIGYVLNALFNYVLKGIFKYPRPNEEITRFHSALKLGKITNHNRFGMPSGHAQIMLYTLSFLYLARINVMILTLIAIITIITLFQRVYFKRHSIVQVIAGSIVGILVGSSFFYFSQLRARDSFTFNGIKEWEKSWKNIQF
jgi:membrane-associated phospholipid phosphatase